MVGLLVGLAVGGLAVGVGMYLLGRLPLSAGERIAYGGALGLGLLAYAVALLAALHWLSGLWLLLALLIAGGLWGWARSLRPWGQAGLSSPPDSPRWIWLVWALVGALMLTALALCLLPPDGNEWDALAYHLAFPKLYLQAGGMVPIPFMHQSYFPPLMDMLFLLGLWLDGEPCAKVFHWLMALLMVVGTAAFVNRVGGQGVWGALLLAGTPVIVWQAFSAYIDLSTALYVGLGAFALWCAVSTRDGRWLWLAGVMMGFALATKYTALLSGGLWVVVGLAWCAWARWQAGLRTLALTAVIAMLMGAPFYIRNWLWTGNPVYPFAYEIFGGRNWSRAQAQAYRNDQLRFGMGREPSQLLMLPWNLTAHPLHFADPIGASVGERVYLLPSAGMGYLATLGLMAGIGVAPGTGWLLALAGLNTLGWFYLMQQVRYLILVFPLLTAAGTSRLRASNGARWLRALYAILLGVQALYTLWLFSNAYLTMVPLALRDREAYLERRLQIYPAIRYLNTQTPPDAGVILLDETRGYYLDRRYLWGNAGHHRLIPYEQFRTAGELTDWLRQHGFRYVLINTRFTPRGTSEPWRRLYMDAIAEGRLQPVFAERGVEVYALE